MKLVGCVAWVERNIPVLKPVKLKPSQDELKVLLDTKDQTVEETSESEGETDQPEPNDFGRSASPPRLRGSQPEGDVPDEEKSEKDPNDPLKEYNLDAYDKEDVVEDSNSLAGLACFASPADDPYITENTSDSDEEDFNLKPNDNLLVVGRFEKDEFTLEVHVYNQDEDSFYVHHDYTLSEPPICLEPIYFDPGSEGKGNLCAVGMISGRIDIWDLNLVDNVDPLLKLGHSKKKRPHKPDLLCHTDAVLDCAWNRNLEHILASSSADTDIIMWDLETAKASSSLTEHTEKVQSIKWHPAESNILLSADCAGCVKLWDCRQSEVKTNWQLTGEVERLCWNHHNPFYFWASTDKGVVYYVDSRKGQLLSVPVSDETISGIAVNPKFPGCLATVSADGCVRVWDYNRATPSQVAMQHLKLGRLVCCGFCPDNPWVLAVGGDKEECLKLFDLHKISEVAERFGGCEGDEEGSKAKRKKNS